MIGTSEFKKGVTLKVEGTPYIIVDFQHVKPGKGNAFVRTKLKNLKSGNVLEKTFKSGEVFDTADIQLMDFDYLYNDGETYHFMNRSTYDQLELSKDTLGGKALYLTENMRIKIHFYEGKPITIELPNFVDLKITYCEPGVKGDSATSSMKPATLETGVTAQVPLHVKLEDVIRIDTRTGDYVEKVTKK